MRTYGAYIGLGYEGSAAINIGRHLFSLRGGKRSLDAVLADAERVIHHEPGDRVALQELTSFSSEPAPTTFILSPDVLSATA